VLLTGCQEEKCIKFVDEDNNSVDAVIHKVDGGEALSLNSIGSLVGISKNGEVCMRFENESYLFSDHYKIISLGEYKTKEYQSFDAIPSVVVLEKTSKIPKSKIDGLRLD